MVDVMVDCWPKLDLPYYPISLSVDPGQILTINLFLFCLMTSYYFYYLFGDVDQVAID